MLPEGAAIRLGGYSFWVDQNSPLEIQTPAFRRRSRSLFRQGLDITGRPGVQNLQPDRLVWQITNFDGEGQAILSGADDVSARRFYRSEGLDMREPGRFQLNPSTILQVPQQSGGTTATKQGAADFSDVSGTSTTSGTDRKLAATGDTVKSSVHTPGAGIVQTDFYLFADPQQLTTVNGSSFTKDEGNGHDSGTTFVMPSPGSRAKLHRDTLGTDPYEVKFYLHKENAAAPPVAVRCSIVDVTNKNDNTITSKETSVVNVGAPGTPSVALAFIPEANHEYAFKVRFQAVLARDQTNEPQLVIDSIQHGKAQSPPNVTISVYNETGTATVLSKQLSVSAFSAGVLIASLTYTAAAATNYSYRLSYDSGPQSPWVDKTVTTIRASGGAAAGWTLDAAELGQGGRVWLAGSQSGADIHTWYYDFVNEDWDAGPDLNATGSSGKIALAMAHTDAYEYILSNDPDLYQITTAADVHYASAAALPSTPVGMTICQNRIFVLGEDSTAGIVVNTLAVDTTAGLPITAADKTQTVSSAHNTADTTLRQRMCATPSGARFFVNYSDIECVIYHANASGSSLVVAELERLDPGAKATAIFHTQGHTFIAGQFLAETGQTPRSALWDLDQSGSLRRIGFFRRTGGTSAPPQFMQPYQNDLWLLQGKYVWRYSLTTGGLFLETQLNPATETYARAMAVLQSHVFSVFSQENATAGAVWVTGSVPTYRQTSVVDGNTFTSSVFDFDLASVDKLLTDIRVQTDTMDDNVYYTVSVQVDQDGNWITLGTETSGKIGVFTSSADLTFSAIQVRVVVGTTDGVNTPSITAITVNALPIEFEEFFDIVVRTEDPDSTDHIAGEMLPGGEKAAALFAMRTQGTPVTLIDGYSFSDPLVNPEYRVRVEDVDMSCDETGEGRGSVRLRVL